MKPVLIGQIIDKDTGAVLQSNYIKEIDCYAYGKTDCMKFETYICFAMSNNLINELIRQWKEKNDGQTRCY